MYFQGFSECVLRFRAYDTRCLHFCRISNWNNCRHVTLVKLLIFVKYVFAAIVQIYFQSFRLWFIGFKAYDTRYQHFFKYQTGQLRITVLKQ